MTRTERGRRMHSYLQTSRLLFRHALCRVGLLDAYNGWRLPSDQMLARKPGEPLQNVFSQIYARKLWIEEDGQDSLSGAGSTHAVTDDLVTRLSALLAEIGCRKLVDIGCGDFNWMKGVTGTFDYLGIDVVPAVIAENTERYGNERRRFLCLDATRDPIEPGDVALCREVLFHLSFEDGLKLLANIKAAGFRYVVLTHDPAMWFNADITSGGFRFLNLAKAPFRLPPPAQALADDRVAEKRILGVWPASALPG